jgi:hypothetical protein
MLLNQLKKLVLNELKRRPMHHSHHRLLVLLVQHLLAIVAHRMKLRTTTEVPAAENELEKP